VTPDELSGRYDPGIGELLMSSAQEHMTGIPDYLGRHIVEVGPGYLVCELDVHRALLNPVGVAHGAVVASLVDHTLGTTVLPVLPAGSWPATLEYKINYLAPTREGVLSARGQVRGLSTRTATVEIECTNQGRLVALALGTVAITPPKS
jgi:uncharacterized protein (TIGR00369 family)